MSERSKIAERIASWLMIHDLCQVFGGDVEQSPDKRHYSVLFSRARWLDGEVSVYSPKYILVRAQGPHAQGNFDAVFLSEADTLRFLQAAFIDYDWDVANAVPTKPRKAC